MERNDWSLWDCLLPYWPTIQLLVTNLQALTPQLLSGFPEIELHSRKLSLVKQVMFGPAIAPLHQSAPWICLGRAGSYTSQCTELVNERPMRKLRKLGEGGYAYVYLARELATPQRPRPDSQAQYALKKVLAGTPERLAATQQEISIQSALAHPNLLPLLDHDTVAAKGSGVQEDASVFMLFPAYTQGTLAEELAARDAAAATAAAGLGKAGAGRAQGAGSNGGPRALLPTAQILQVLQQLCSALEYMHGRGYAHRDIKPHNILLHKPPSLPSASSSGASQPPGCDNSGHGQIAITIKGGGGVTAAEESQPLISPSQPSVTMPQGGKSGHGHGQGHSRQQGWRVVVMDFGSARQRQVVVGSRAEALAVQEDAEANCTAPYRAPELYDCPSPAVLDLAAADVWSLGATAYALMYGDSPFQIQANQQGASMALAVMNAVVPFPKDPAHAYPEPLQQLVRQCLVHDPAARPTAAQLGAAVAGLVAQQGLGDPPGLLPTHRS